MIDLHVARQQANIIETLLEITVLLIGQGFDRTRVERSKRLSCIELDLFLGEGSPAAVPLTSSRDSVQVQWHILSKSIQRRQ